MAVTQAQLDALVAAWAAGAVRVTVDGRTIDYGDVSRLERQIGTVAGALGVPNPLTPSIAATPRYSLARHTRS